MPNLWVDWSEERCHSLVTNSSFYMEVEQCASFSFQKLQSLALTEGEKCRDLTKVKMFSSTLGSFSDNSSLMYCTLSNWGKIGETQSSRLQGWTAWRRSGWVEYPSRHFVTQPAFYYVLTVSAMEKNGGVLNQTVPWYVCRTAQPEWWMVHLGLSNIKPPLSLAWWFSDLTKILHLQNIKSTLTGL